MPLSTYTELQAAIANWAWRTGDTEFEAAVPEMIVLAEERINERLRVSDMETVAYATMTDGMVPVPDDFLEARRLISDGTGAFNTPLQLITPDFAGATYASTNSGVPVHYTLSGGVLTTFPNGGTDQVTMIYYASVPPLASNETNWLLTKAPNVYLTGSMVQASIFMEDQGQEEKWEARFQEAINRLQSADQRSRYANTVTRLKGAMP